MRGNSCPKFQSLLLFFFAVGLLQMREAQAYPEFIGYGYASCLTCHYNASGGGPLSDYGRALWAAEIAARPLWSNKTDEQLGETSGFWFNSGANTKLKPYVKYRGLVLQTQPGTEQSKSRYIQMQADIGASYLFDEKGDWLISGAIGYVPTPQGASPDRKEESSNIISREYYVRKSLKHDWWLYVGFMDKMYGYKTPDHTAFSRRAGGATQNDQVHSIVFYRAKEKYDLFVQLHGGNLFQRPDLREEGSSFSYEGALSENWRAGGSVAYTQNDYVRRTRLALLTRTKIGSGHAFLFEGGVSMQDPADGSQKSTAGYALSEFLVRIARGYFVQLQFEYLKDKLESDQPQNLRGTFGFLLFPLQRVELRTAYVLNRVMDPAKSTTDTSNLQLQLHLSL
jgi:hypothetical protein